MPGFPWEQSFHMWSSNQFLQVMFPGGLWHVWPKAREKLAVIFALKSSQVALILPIFQSSSMFSHMPWMVYYRYIQKRAWPLQLWILKFWWILFFWYTFFEYLPRNLWMFHCAIFRTARKANLGPETITIKTNNCVGIYRKAYGHKSLPFQVYSE